MLEHTMAKTVFFSIAYIYTRIAVSRKYDATKVCVLLEFILEYNSVSYTFLKHI